MTTLEPLLPTAELGSSAPPDLMITVVQASSHSDIVSEGSVRFGLSRMVKSTVVELGEEASLRKANADAGLRAWLIELDSLAGRLVVGEESISDDLDRAVRGLCFDAVQALVEPRPTFECRSSSSAERLALATSADCATITIADDGIALIERPAPALLIDLYVYGRRYIALLEELGRLGRHAVAAQLSQLRSAAEHARIALRSAGPACGIVGSFDGMDLP